MYNLVDKNNIVLNKISKLEIAKRGWLERWYKRKLLMRQRRLWRRMNKPINLVDNIKRVFYPNDKELSNFRFQELVSITENLGLYNIEFASDRINDLVTSLE